MQYGHVADEYLWLLLDCLASLLLVLQGMSSHFENVNVKTESHKVILKPTGFAFLCSSEEHEVDFFAWIFQVN